MEYLTKSAQETKRLGEKIGANLKPGDLLACFGQLGGGKTTFLQGVAKALGIKERILSPTFILMRQYELPYQKRGIERFYHWDWYRICGEKEALAAGFGENLLDPKAVVAVEWAENAPQALPRKRIEVHFEYGEKEKERKIKIIRKNC
jgi:tRNA threonylcarbamoyladenosine biosynthesis protein TsaE